MVDKSRKSVGLAFLCPCILLNMAWNSLDPIMVSPVLLLPGGAGNIVSRKSPDEWLLFFSFDCNRVEKNLHLHFYNTSMSVYLYM